MPASTTPRIFISLGGPTIRAMENQIVHIGGAPIGYELRLDFLEDTTHLETRLHQMLLRLHSPATIATCRRVEAGGRFQGSIESQVAVLSAAVRAGCHWVDVEMESVTEAGPTVLRQLRPAKLIVSFHDYKRTPPLGPIYRQMARLPIQVAKIVGHARSLRDNLAVIKLTQEHRGRHPKIVSFGMGPSGLPSRVLALRWGCPFIYAAAGNKTGVAPGQIPGDVMRSLYRVERIDHRTQYYGVVGSRASTSLSPVMHNTAFQAKHINAAYLPCETARLADFLTFARQMGFLGFSITMPFKRAIMRHLDWVDPLAARIGACNTVAVQQGKWMGWNTDAAAVVEVLTKRLRLAGSRILILGAGGAARAAVYALRAEGAVVFISARREAAAQQLARGISARVVPWGSTEDVEVDAVINATPAGMTPYTESLPVDLARLRVRVVFEMVYHPPETRLLAEARGRGLTAISGLEMLVAQGARQFEIWTGQAAPRALMEQAIRQTLDHLSPV